MLDLDLSEEDLVQIERERIAHVATWRASHKAPLGPKTIHYVRTRGERKGELKWRRRVLRTGLPDGTRVVRRRGRWELAA